MPVYYGSLNKVLLLEIAGPSTDSVAPWSSSPSDARLSTTDSVAPWSSGPSDARLSTTDSSAAAAAVVKCTGGRENRARVLIFDSFNILALYM